LAPATGGDNNITYQWQSSTNATFTAPVTINSNTATYDPPGNITVNTWYRRLAKDNTCNAPFTNSTGVWAVTVNALPNNTTSGFAGSPICFGETGVLRFNAIDASFIAPYSIQYTDGTTTWSQTIDNAAEFSFNVAVNPVSTTTYSLVSITNGNGCTRTTDFGKGTAQISVRSLPTASINAAFSICENEDANFTITGTSGATVTYNINGDTNTTVVLTGGLATVTIPAATTDQVLTLVSVTDANCTKTLSDNSTVTVNPLPLTSEIITD
jgi:hypothetical protein